jgi:DNA-directed RNA polymerase subunit RPC12/RpoP
MAATSSNAISFSCLHCGRKFRVGADQAGRTARCYGCHGSMVIPKIAQAVAVGALENTMALAPSVANPQRANGHCSPPPLPTPSHLESEIEPPPEQNADCRTCGSPVRRVRAAGKPTQKTLCVICSPPNGYCPLCGGTLRKPQSQQCMHCKKSWHGAVNRELKATRSSNETKPILQGDVVSDGVITAWEVIFPDASIRRFERIVEIRELLKSGALNRSSYCRVLHPRPANDASREAKTEWEHSRRFRQIGATLAGTEFEIRALYDPEQAHGEVGANAGAGMGLVAAIAVGLILGLAGEAWNATVGGLLLLVALAMLGRWVPKAWARHWAAF